MRRRQLVVALDPVFRRQILEIDPYRLVRLRRHRFDVSLRQLAGKGLDHQLGGLRLRKRLAPQINFHSPALLLLRGNIRLRAQFRQAGQIIHP